jgi:uncharacterized membrane protein
LANGGPACVLVILFFVLVHRWAADNSRYLLMLFTAAIATVNADTWATEIGGLSPSSPRSLANWKLVERGTSGAITWLGVVAALIGSAVVPFSVYWAWGLNKNPAEFFAIAWAGFLGSFVDSLIGASIQGQYRDPVSGGMTELTSVAGRKTTQVKGMRWVNNNVVNLLAGLAGAACAWLLLKYAVYAVH